MRKFVSKVLFVVCGAGLLLYSAEQAAYAGDYIGSKACAECHKEQYDSYMAHSKKAKSWHSVEVMAGDLTPAELEECYDCHTTGHGKGGFVSIDKTPQFADVGCETCHGPGARHAEEGGDPSLITRTPELAVCEHCHNNERVAAFNYKPLIYSGAH